jgi:hypothetical protein
VKPLKGFTLPTVSRREVRYGAIGAVSSLRIVRRARVGAASVRGLAWSLGPLDGLVSWFPDGCIRST